MILLESKLFWVNKTATNKLDMKKLQGKIISLKMQQSAVVEVERKWAHPLYQKQVKSNKNYTCALDQEKLQVNLGDLVEIVETRPLSKTKRFRITRKIGK